MKKSLYEIIYKKFDGKYGDLVNKFVEEKKLTTKLCKKIDKLESEIKNYKELLGEYKNKNLKTELKNIELSFK